MELYRRTWCATEEHPPDLVRDVEPVLEPVRNAAARSQPALSVGCPRLERNPGWNPLCDHSGISGTRWDAALSRNWLCRSSRDPVGRRNRDEGWPRVFR